MSKIFNQRESTVEKKISVDLEHLRNLMSNELSDERFMEAKKILDSIVERHNYARYHYREYRNIIDAKENVDGEHILPFLVNDENLMLATAIEANILACMQHLHASHDILSHLLSYSLNIEFDDEQYITLNNVQKKMQGITKYTVINNLLNELIENENFKYLTANVNHSKHRYNIVPSIRIDLRDKPHIKCLFSSFVHKQTNYSEKDLDEFLKDELQRELLLVIDIENTVIDLLKDKEF